MSADLVLELLRGARERVARGWTQGVFARDAAGREVGSAAPEACTWDALGGLRAAEIGLHAQVGAAMAHELFRLARLAVERVPGVRDLYNWNDAPGRTQAEVLAVLDQAIAAREAGR